MFDEQVHFLNHFSVQVVLVQLFLLLLVTPLVTLSLLHFSVQILNTFAVEGVSFSHEQGMDS